MAEPAGDTRRTVAEHGDRDERRWWGLFAEREFPSFAAGWRVLAAGEPADDEGAVLVQLHGSVLAHLGRVFELRTAGVQTFDQAVEAFVRLAAAGEVGDEVLGRVTRPGTYEPWSPAEGRRAVEAWRERREDALAGVRGYRDRLLQGRVVPDLRVTFRGPERAGGQALLLPRLERVDAYLDRRRAATLDRDSFEDFDDSAAVVGSAWVLVVAYLEGGWRERFR